MLLHFGERIVDARPLSMSLPLVGMHWSLEDRIAGILRPDRRRERRVGWRSVVLAAPALIAALVFAAGIVVGGEADGPGEDARQSEPDEEDSRDTVSAEINLDDPRQLVQEIARRSAHWVAPASPKLKTLDYTFIRGHEPRLVKLVKGESRVRYSVWQGCGLRTGIHALLGEPERFAIKVEAIDDQALRVVASVKDAERPVGVEVGNGIDSSWSGFFSHSSRDVVLLVDRKRLIPLEEQVASTTLRYREWKEVEQGRWVPSLVDVLNGETRYQMHFDWMGDAVWLLTRAESVSRNGKTVLTRTRNVVVNNTAVKRELTEEELRWREAGAVVRRMLDRNRPWLQPGLSAFDSIGYTFHTVREDVREACYLTKDRVAFFEVVHDGKGKMGDRLGDRRIALPGQETAYADRDSRFAKISPRPERLKNQPYDEALRHYARIGCQFDLPIFRYHERLDAARITVEDGQWEGRPCHVAQIRNLGRDVYLGAGTMLGFTSWSYVHHIRPEYELVYIDKERHVPIHETLHGGRNERTFEIDFSDYVEVTPERWAPLSIRVESNDSFTSDYRFQLVEGKHWLLKDVVSWFDPDDKSRGVVEDVRVNQPSASFQQAMDQIEASRQLFGEKRTERTKRSVVAVPFALGRRLQVGPYSVLFAFADRLNVEVNIEARDKAADVVPLLLLDEQDRALFATNVSLAAKDGKKQGSAKLGFSQALADVRSLVMPGVSPDKGSAHTVSVLPCRWDEPLEISICDQAKGKTCAYEVLLTRSANGHARAKLSLASQDGPKEFLLDVSAALLDEDGRLVAAGLNNASLHVERSLVEAEHGIDLGPVDDPSRPAHLVIAVTAGNTLSSPGGSKWMTWMQQPVPFPLETLQAADDAGCWKVALGILRERMKFREALLDDPRAELEEDLKARAQVLQPHAKWLARIVPKIDDQTLLIDVVGLLGHAGDRGQVDVIGSLLNRSEREVADTAAAALGMLGQQDGFDRLRAVLDRQRPSWDDDRDAYMAYRRLETDVIIALGSIGDDRSVDLLGETLMNDLRRLRVKTNEKEREYLDGRPGRVQKITSILGIADNARAVRWLTDACRFYDEHEDVERLADRIPLVQSLLAYENQTRELIAEHIAKSDFAFIRAFKSNGHYDPYYVPAVHKMMLDPDKTAWTAHQGVSYLWNAGTPEALAVLRDAHEKRMHKDDARTNLYMCEALAALGDDRGLVDAFEALVELFQDTEPPAGEEQKQDWEYRRKWLDDGAKDVLKRARKSSIADFVESHADADQPAERRALIELLWQLPETPESIKMPLRRWQIENKGEIAEQASQLLQRD